MTEIRPQAGPQEAFAACTADVAIYGGAAGGGKSWALIFEVLKWIAIAGFNAIIFRRLSTELTGGGSVWEEAAKIYPLLGGAMREHRLDCRFPSGALVELKHLQYAQDVRSHLSKQYALIEFDELTQFEESQFWFLFSRNRSTCGVKPYIRAATNPDPDSWVRKLIDWWIGDDGLPIQERAGVLRWFVRIDDELCWADSPDELREQYPQIQHDDPTSLTFIPAKLGDNPALTDADPQYESRLNALQSVKREQLKGGNWNARVVAGSFFKREYFPVIERRPECRRLVRWWDFAASEPSTEYPDPDWTRGILAGEMMDGRTVLLGLASCRLGPGERDRYVERIAAHDGEGVTIGLWQDPGQAGKSQAYDKRTALAGYTTAVEVASKSKTTYAEPVSSQAELGNIVVLRGEWNDVFFSEAEGFPGGAHDDIIDALSGAFRHLVVGRTVMIDVDPDSGSEDSKWLSPGD